jgi:hypothetical protein
MDPVSGSPGSFAAQAANLGFDGRWQIRVNVRRSAHDDVESAFQVAVPGAAGTRNADATAFPLSAVTPLQAVGAALLVAALVLLALRWRIGIPRLPGKDIGVAAAVVAIVGVALLPSSTFTSDGAGSGAGAQNAAVPVDATAVTGTDRAARGGIGRGVATLVVPAQAADSPGGELEGADAEHRADGACGRRGWQGLDRRDDGE